MKHAPIEPLETRIAPAILFAIESGTNKLISFQSTAPGTLITDTTISGLQPNEIVTGMDFRPATGELYALGVVDNGATRTGRLYMLNTATAAATLVGNAPFSNVLADTGNYGFDFNPAVDRIRLVDEFDNSYRLNPDTGALVATDTDLDDAGGLESITAVAYTGGKGNSITTLYGYNFAKDEIVLIGGKDGNPSPNTGVVTTVAHLKINGANTSFNSSSVGFDIAELPGGPEQGWLAGRTGTNNLFTLDLATANMVDLGPIGNGSRIITGLSVSLAAPAPAISADGKTATWTDLDGDAVTLKTTKGILTPGAFTMLAGHTGSALSKLVITDAVFAGANISVTAKRGANGGDGAVNIGTIDATGRDLGAVTVAGDLSVIRAGDANTVTAALKSLSVRSIGKFAAQLVGITGETSSVVSGPLGSLKIAGDLSSVFVADKIVSAVIGGDMKGVAPSFTSLLGAGVLGVVTIKGNVDGADSATSISAGAIANLTIGGNLIGGALMSSGGIQFSSSAPAKITIKGSMLGGDGDKSAGIFGTGNGALSLTVKGSVISKTGGLDSATIAFGGAGTIAIGGSVIGSNISGDVAVGMLKSLTIGGDLLGNTIGSGVTAARIGKLVVKGSIAGPSDNPIRVTAYGALTPANQSAAVAIGSIAVGGSVTNAFIGAGYFLFTSANGDAAIGTIKIGGELIASTIAAGIASTNNTLGDFDDAVEANNNTLGIVARIASISVGGPISGTPGGGTDFFGILAESIGSITVNKTKLPLTAAKDDFTIGFTGDVRVREL